MTDLASRIRRTLPRGTSLAEDSWQVRHRVIVAVLAAHIPLLLVVGLAAERDPLYLVVALTPLAVVTLLAVAHLGRVARAVAATLGLIASSATLVHITGGLVEAHFHFFLTIALISLYQDWRPYLVAIAGVVTHHGVVAAWFPEAAASQEWSAVNPWGWALIHGGFVLVVALVHLGFWKITEREQERAQALWQQLYEGERGLNERLASAEALKNELVAVVSHEFRTPLTSIIGFSHTLVARADDLDPATIRLCVRNIDQQSRRLARLVHNVLAASGDVATDPAAVTDVAAMCHHVAREIGDLYEDASPIAIRAPRTLRAQVDNDAAYRILVNLVENAVKFSVPGSEVGLRAFADEGCAVVEIGNEACPIAESQLDRIFAPFVQVDSSDSRSVEGIGLGLHVVRRLVEAYEGEVAVRHEDGRVVFRVALPLASRPPITLPDAVTATGTPR
jgi:signal transduction histidine kinase